MSTNVKKLFNEKVSNIYQKYLDKWNNMSKEELIENAGDIAVVRITAKALKEWEVEEDMEYLMRFADPIWVVGDIWREGIDFGNLYIHGNFDDVVSVMREDGYAEEQYELDPEYVKYKIVQMM